MNNKLNMLNDMNKYDLVKFRELLDTKKIYIFDGIIGAGKTTTIKLIGNNLKNNGKKVHCIYEPVDIWREAGALNEFYKNIPEKCYEFQTFTYITRIKRVISEILDNQDADIYLLERSIFTDKYIFVELLRDLMGPIRMRMYNEWWDMWNMLLPIKVEKWILLNTSLEESIQRICKRDRFEEKNSISIEYQKNLYDKHHEFFNILNMKEEKTVIIPSEIMDDNVPEKEELIQRIVELIFI
jgi:deoxyadenosine/deoxycytidine kinase